MDRSGGSPYGPEESHFAPRPEGDRADWFGSEGSYGPPGPQGPHEPRGPQGPYEPQGAQGGYGGGVQVGVAGGGLPPPASGFDEPGDPFAPMGGDPYFAPDAPGGGRDFGPPRGGARRRRTGLPLIIGAAALAGIVLVGGGFVLSKSLRDDAEPKAAAAPSKAPPAAGPTTPPPVRTNAKIRTRVTDPKPLTLNEIFGRRTFVQQRTKYVRTNRNVVRDCTKTVSGVRFVAVLKKAGCTQSLRATFARSDGKLIGTIGVLNLRSEAAVRATKRAGTGKDTFLRALPGGGVTKKIGQGAAFGTVEVHGHYLVMTWVQRPDGKLIPAGLQKYVSSFVEQIKLGSNLSRALYFRGYEGRPFRS